LALCVAGAGTIWFNPTDELRDSTRAVSLLILAGVGALIATRGIIRRLVSIIVLFSGVGLMLGGTVLCLIAGITVVFGGFLAVLTCATWPVMGTRYERAAKVEQTDLWAALDRCEDPTAR
jgi:hypothetical protein